MSIPRPEYPRPQFARADWLCLNGEWQFEIDSGDSGLERGLLGRDLNSTITVPFCPESELSGIGNPDFMPAVWYRREVTIPAGWAGKRVLLHFQAVDYDTTVWIDGAEVARHRGGFTPFSVEVPNAQAGANITIVVRARDPHGIPQPRGKQSHQFAGHGALYGRTTGIWQTVWLEPVPVAFLQRARITPDVANGVVRITQPISGARPRGAILRATLRDEHGAVCSISCTADADFAPQLDLPIPAERRRLWSIDDPFLYDLDIELLHGEEVIDHVQSYAGLRSVTIDGKAIKINGAAVFQRLVLDQGYYPDGILTAPSDEALVRDIQLSMDAGFNGARLHQKVFEERFLYHADRMGYIVWGEFPDWGCSHFGPENDHQRPGPSYITEWLEAIERDYSHPSIVGWCPLNETWQQLTDRTSVLDDVTRGMFLATKAMDNTRPVLDTSGYAHRVPEADVYDSHDYDQNPASFKVRHAGLADGTPYLNPAHGSNRDQSIPYRGQPYFVSEFGGIWWSPAAKEGEDSWGYGERVRSLDEFYTRFEGLFDALLGDPLMFGYCYTQLTDVYQEQNGIYTFDRGTKFDMERIRAVQQQPAAIEEASR
jgi:beta-galactosidase/beta-glucuronidase